MASITTSTMPGSAGTTVITDTKKKPKSEPATTTTMTTSTTTNTYKPPRATPIKRALPPEDMTPHLALIASSNRTPFEKRVWTALCAIPRGRFTTYALLSRHLGTSPRAVGNALRRNPFAPGVPCHRVVATGGALGGFKGSWPKDGEGITLDEKRGLLRGEGVRFDEGGRVVGTPWAFK
ncbi:Methylated-DNA--protein-cysteine methyltransferase-like protein [Hapsidospora chrysogenum ATCC 11550]|uniref:Methylated-DNA--protein-cysteine methyltransferase n=1 Tax=Hapsidospora chrysogenum (strain ATCC 11550 / CBS 779.69 / DSM 880 / IAM 14645 / JCM 23072 / IMI 49137) TaxID=857340 RepID=A0A086SUC4_HAPC1|nr:Methylated-DNA--protein-cysteine methyltransferase-like protein [Hapsidospora chrysogenum ATCC 11550]